MSNEYKKGQKVKLTGTFTLSGTETDPTTVELKVKTPAGVVTTYTLAEAEITQESAGVFSKEIAADQEGVYKFGFIGAGTVATAEFSEFWVRAWPFS